MTDLLTPEQIATLRQRAERAEAERDYYRKAIQDFQDGNYAHPRAFRAKDVGHGVGKCCHGTWYWEECESCNSEHFDNALTNGPAAQSAIAELNRMLAFVVAAAGGVVNVPHGMLVNNYDLERVECLKIDSIIFRAKRAALGGP